MNYANNAYSVLDGAIGSGDTAILLAAGTGARFPAGNFLATLIGYDGSGNENAWEIVLCSTRSGDTLTVTRAQEGTAAKSWPDAARIENRLTAGSLYDFLSKSGGTLFGNLEFSGNGIRIRGDMSNATLNNRMMFQTTEANGVTELGVIPNGTGAESYVTLSNKSDPSNASRFYMTVKPAEARLESSKLGTGTYLPMAFYTNGAQKFAILADTTGTFSFGGSAPRITGDLTNNTVANRLTFQTNIANGSTAITAIPNGTGTISALQMANNSSPTNSSIVDLRVSSTEVALAASIFGTGTFLPLNFYAGGANRISIATDGKVGIGKTPGAQLDYRESVDVISTNTTAVASRTYVLTASLTLTLPASPTAGDWVRIVNRSDTATPIVGRNGQNIMGLAEDMTLDSTTASLRLVFADAARGWVLN